jgi:hypothetical protein
MRAGTNPLNRAVAVAALVLLAAGALFGAGFRYWNALPAEVPPSPEASTVAALAGLALGIVLLSQVPRSRAELGSTDPWAILAEAALAGVLAGLINGPLPNNARAFRGTVHLELTSPIKAKFDAAATVYCETVPGTERIAWLSATSMVAAETPKPETPPPDAPELELPALSLYLAIGGGRPAGISIASSLSDEPMTGVATSLEIVARDRSGRAAFSGLYTEEAWIGPQGVGYLDGSVRWVCSDRLPDFVREPGG